MRLRAAPSSPTAWPSSICRPCATPPSSRSGSRRRWACPSTAPPRTRPSSARRSAPATCSWWSIIWSACASWRPAASRCASMVSMRSVCHRCRCPRTAPVGHPTQRGARPCSSSSRGQGPCRRGSPPPARHSRRSRPSARPSTACRWPPSRPPRIKLFPPEALLPRLGARLALLTDGPRDLPERQRTMRAALDWSYALLAPAEGALFARLGVG